MTEFSTGASPRVFLPPRHLLSQMTPLLGGEQFPSCGGVLALASGVVQNIEHEGKPPC
ncbi:MAG: hypothetical protein FWG85_03640 [Bacteroidetes bacterium]|nr:hypothetical protein [Bacteroidota bacterium]